jgi:hypothetical protein
MKKRRKLFLLLAVSLLVLAGWGQKKVELLSDKKLIDLSVAIGNCTLGAEDLIPDEGDNTQDPNSPTATPGPAPTVTPKVSPTPWPTDAPKPTLPAKPRVQDISVRDQVVTYNYVPWPKLDILAEQLRRDHNEWTTFRLIDDFAEAHVYRQMLEILNELEAEIGLSYTTK